MLADRWWLLRRTLPELWQTRWRFDQAVTRRYLAFGLPLGLASLALIGLLRFDNFLIGTFVGVNTLGYYDRAYRTAQWPVLLLSAIVTRAALYIYVRLQGTGRLSEQFSYNSGRWKLNRRQHSRTSETPATGQCPARSDWKIGAGLVLTAVVVRLLLTAVARDIVDVQNYERVAETLLAHGPGALYALTPDIYPYPPPWAAVEVAAKWLETEVGLDFSTSVRLPGIAADASITYLLWHWLRQRRRCAAVVGGLAYALNPLSLIITCLHGQFDAIPAALSLLAVYWAMERPRLALSAVSLGAAIAFKSYPVLLLAPLLLAITSGRTRVRYALLALAPASLLLLPYLLVSPEAVMHELFGYRGAALLGFMVPLRTIYVPLTGQHFPVATTLGLVRGSAFVFLTVYLALLIRLPGCRVNLLEAVSAVLALFYAVYGGVAPQYLLWLAPFSVLLARRERWFVVHTLIGTAALLGFYAYAVPEIFPLALNLPVRVDQAAYGLSGTAWWLVSLTLTGRLLWRVAGAARQPEPVVEPGPRPATLV